MKKILACGLLIACLLSVTACSSSNGESESIQESVANKTFVYEKEGFVGEFTIQIQEDGTFRYYEGGLSSHIGVGSWTVDKDILVLTEDEDTGYPGVNRFAVKDGDLVFLSEGSDNFIYVKVADGDHFFGPADTQ